MAPAARDVGVPAPYRSHDGARWAAAPEGVGRHRCRPPPPPRQPPFPEMAGGSSQERRCNLPQPPAAGGACSITRSRQQASFDGSEPSAMQMPEQLPGEQDLGSKHDEDAAGASGVD